MHLIDYLILTIKPAMVFFYISGIHLSTKLVNINKIRSNRFLQKKNKLD